MPKVSVIMSFYNDENYIDEAVKSILNQTFKNFEFLIVDDGSVDESANVVRSFNDSRIFLIKHKKNLGLTRSLNDALNRATGEYIARMDADDVSFPQRLEKQVQFLEKYKEHGLCGCWVCYIGPKDEVLRVRRFPTAYEDLSKIIIRYNPFVHSTLVIRRDILKKIGGYDLWFKYAQDYDLALRIAAITKVANLGEVLLKYRIEPDKGISFRKQKEQEKYAILARVKALRKGDYPFWHWMFLIKPLIFYLIPSLFKIYILKNFVWKRY